MKELMFFDANCQVGDTVTRILPGIPELPPADEFFALMKEKRAGALTLDPVNHRFIACRLSLGRILGEAAKRRVPVLLNCFSGKWEVLYSFLKEFPELVCIIHGERGVIEDLVRRVGSGCMLFGTDLPWFDEYQAAGGVLSADISEDDMRNIFYRNAENIFGKEW